MATKEKRMESVLLALIELYLQTGKPVASQTLKDESFPELSSATLRNYFATLEEDGFLAQHHASAGRVPTEKAFLLYARLHQEATALSKEDELFLESFLFKETKEIGSFLTESIEALSELSGCPVFLSSPRFDHDGLSSIRLVNLDANRYLAILITDFTVIETEIVFSPKRWNAFALKRMEEFFQSKLDNRTPPNLSEEELNFAGRLYNELVLRHVVTYTTFRDADIYRCGFSQLLQFPEFRDPLLLAETLSLFERGSPIHNLMSQTFKKGQLSFWIGQELRSFIPCRAPAAVMAIPYTILDKHVGVIALLGPDRQNYPRNFALLKRASTLLGKSLSQSSDRYKISYREAFPQTSLELNPQLLIGQKTPFDVRNKNA